MLCRVQAHNIPLARLKKLSHVVIATALAAASHRLGRPRRAKSRTDQEPAVHYRELFQLNPIKTVIELEDANARATALQLVERFVVPTV